MAKTLITCDCLGSQTIDAEALSKATGHAVAPPCSALCTTQIARAATAMTGPDAADTIICCTQEARTFEALAEEGTVSPRDLDLITWCETADEAWAAISEFYELKD